MPKCIECGVTLPRLQWTHFKYKCTGRVNNSAEYRKCYPGAQLVDEELCKRTAITEATLIAKYGEQEGLVRWNNYKELQAYSNTFEYKQENHNWTIDEYELYNKGRAVTLDKCIERYGEIDGKVIWDNYVEKQRYSNTLEYFQEKYGNTGLDLWLEYNQAKGNSSNIEFIMKKYSCSFIISCVIPFQNCKTWLIHCYFPF
jgi:hypothetical protein